MYIYIHTLQNIYIYYTTYIYKIIYIYIYNDNNNDDNDNVERDVIRITLVKIKHFSK